MVNHTHQNIYTQVNVVVINQIQMNLRTFLKKHKVLTEFKENYKQEQVTHSNLGTTDKGEIVSTLSPEQYLKEHGFEYFTLDVFRWSKTAKGFKFWNNLNSKWDKLNNH